MRNLSFYYLQLFCTRINMADRFLFFSFLPFLWGELCNFFFCSENFQTQSDPFILEMDKGNNPNVFGIVLTAGWPNFGDQFEV